MSENVISIDEEYQYRWGISLLTKMVKNDQYWKK